VEGGGRPGWEYVDDFELQANVTYFVKCKPGCDALVEDDPHVSGPWRLVGEITPGKPGQGPDGVYKLYCRTGDGQACHARLIPV
jgi:hypothetical protein